jgi:subtilisin-like proprotein convertase family protein/uncharacterized protein YvpB
MRKTKSTIYAGLAFILPLILLVASRQAAWAQSAAETPAPTPSLTLQPPRREPVEPALAASETPLPGSDIPSPAAILSATQVLTTTRSISATLTLTPTETLTPTVTITPSATPTFSPYNYLPLINLQPSPTPTPTTPPPPPETVLYCSAPYAYIPDYPADGIANSIDISDPRFIQDLNVRLEISHSWVSDLSIRLTHEESGRTITLIDRPGLPANPPGCGYDHIGAILDDEFSLPVENECSASPAAIAGIFTPNEPLKSFDNESLAGRWTLSVVDNAETDTGTLKTWCMEARIGGPDPDPNPDPIPSLPPRARIYNISGQPQALPLDCESRVAVDWAGYFGYHINELQFFNRLPHSDNPDAGFVGDVYGVWGQIPPYPYGVHAEPVAALLQAYGVPAYTHRPLRWDELKAEIAAGRPVYVWTIGAANSNEVPIYYTSSDGLRTIVAHYEHVVIVVGYTESDVIIMDGGTFKTRSIQQFLGSWSALGNMAILNHP